MLGIIKSATNDKRHKSFSHWSYSLVGEKLCASSDYIIWKEKVDSVRKEIEQM